MFTLGSKAVVVNSDADITVSGTSLSILGFGTFDTADPGFSIVASPPTLGVATTYSSIDLAAAGLAPGKEVAIYWQNLKYIGDGVTNMSTKPQQPMVINWPATDPNITTVAEAWEHRQETLGISNLFNVTGNILSSINPAVNIISSAVRDMISPTERWDKPESGFMYGGFGGTVSTPGTLVPGSEGVGNGWQVEASVRTDSPWNTDPYSDKPHGSDTAELDALYDIYSFEMQEVHEAIPANLAQAIADQSIINRPVQFRIYAKQGSASTAVAAWIGVAPA